MRGVPDRRQGVGLATKRRALLLVVTLRFGCPPVIRTAARGASAPLAPFPPWPGQPEYSPAKRRWPLVTTRTSRSVDEQVSQRPGLGHRSPEIRYAGACGLLGRVVRTVPHG